MYEYGHWEPRARADGFTSLCGLVSVERTSAASWTVHDERGKSPVTYGPFDSERDAVDEAKRVAAVKPAKMPRPKG